MRVIANALMFVGVLILGGLLVLEVQTANSSCDYLARYLHERCDDHAGDFSVPIVGILAVALMATLYNLRAGQKLYLFFAAVAFLVAGLASAFGLFMLVAGGALMAAHA
ncbi:MAG: hypothetical protein ACHP7N_18005 [Caulobacterales bacterium]